MMKSALMDLVDVYSIERAGCREFWFTDTRDGAEGPAMLEDLCSFLNANNADAVSIRLFGDRENIAHAVKFIEQNMKEIACPPLLILQPNSSGLGVQVQAFSGMNSRALYFDDEFVGREFRDSSARYLMLRVLPESQIESQYDQTANLFDRADRMLKHFANGFNDTIRTWLYADDILSWYDKLNKARNIFFEANDVYNNLVPASTGIGVGNPSGKALATQVLAMIPESNDVSVSVADSPLQASAMDYKSSFSRGVVVKAPDHHRLYISGTASIDKSGQTIFQGDTTAQLDMTMQVVEGILNAAGMDWSDTATSMVYFKYRKDFDLFDKYCLKHGIDLPHVKVEADVCRDNLLFELELDAVKTV